MKENEELQFLRESNAIERVYDEQSLEQAFYAWSYLKRQKSISPFVICKTHKILMQNQPILESDKGHWRNQPVMIGIEIKGNSLEEIQNSIKQWCLNTNDIIQNGKNEPKMFLENIITDHHVTYEDIHPFIDGNGRTGRMLMNWERLKLGLPILIIKEKEKQDYYKWFD